jgi:hypothetical protein
MVALLRGTKVRGAAVVVVAIFVSNTFLDILDPLASQAGHQ